LITLKSSISIIIVFAFSLALHAEITGFPFSITVHENTIHVGKRDGVFTYDPENLSESKIYDINNVVKLKSIGGNLYALAVSDSSTSLHNISSSDSFHFDENYFRDFYQISEGVIALISPSENALYSFDIEKNELTNITSQAPSFETPDKTIQENFYIPTPYSADGSDGISFIYSKNSSAIYFVNSGTISVFSECRDEICDKNYSIEIEENVSYPFYFSPAFFEHNTKLKYISSNLSVVFSSKNLIFSSNFGSLELLEDTESEIVDFDLYEDKIFILHENSVEILEL